MLEVLLISSQKGTAMLFPKVRGFMISGSIHDTHFEWMFDLFSCLFMHMQGGWETDESKTEAAARETEEEAGVLGIVEVRLFFALLDPAHLSN